MLSRNTGPLVSIFLQLLLSAFLSIIIIYPYLLYIAWIEGFAIFMAVFVVSMVTAVNDYAKEKQFLELQKVGDDKKKVTYPSLPLFFTRCPLKETEK